MRLKIIPDDKFIFIDDDSTNDADMSWIPDEVHAVQWYGDHGYIEYKTGDKLNEKITDLGVFSQAIEAFNDAKEKEKQKRIEREASIDYWKVFRGKRINLLEVCDWTTLPDAPITAEERQEWLEYRQKLRDLPETTTDPKNPDWPEPPAGKFGDTMRGLTEIMKEPILF